MGVEMVWFCYCNGNGVIMVGHGIALVLLWYCIILQWYCNVIDMVL